MDIQHLYIPGLHLYRNQLLQARAASDPEPQVYKTELFLPSAIPTGKVACDSRLQEFEWELREAQAQDALNDLRDNLRLRSHVYKDKDRFQQGQRRSTRSRDLINNLERRISAARDKYIAARNALQSLAGKLKKGTTWTRELRILTQGDITPLVDDDLPAHMRAPRESQGRRKLSWIWQRLGKDDYDNASDIMQDGKNIRLTSLSHF